MTHDYSDFTEDAPAPGDNLMTALTQKADEHEAAEAEVERLEKLLEEAKGNLRRISEKEIPDLMDGLEGSLNLPDGRTIKVAEKIRANVPKDKKPIAYKWLDDNGRGSIISRQIVLDFNKDQGDLAKRVLAMVQELDEMVNFKTVRNVPWQTMDAFVREALEEGIELPPEIGVYRQFFTKIK